MIYPTGLGVLIPYVAFGQKNGVISILNNTHASALNSEQQVYCVPCDGLETWSGWIPTISPDDWD